MLRITHRIDDEGPPRVRRFDSPSTQNIRAYNAHPEVCEACGRKGIVGSTFSMRSLVRGFGVGPGPSSSWWALHAFHFSGTGGYTFIVGGAHFSQLYPLTCFHVDDPHAGSSDSPDGAHVTKFAASCGALSKMVRTTLTSYPFVRPRMGPNREVVGASLDHECVLPCGRPPARESRARFTKNPAHRWPPVECNFPRCRKPVTNGIQLFGIESRSATRRRVAVG